MIYLNRKSNEPLYSQLYNQIKEEILSGALKEGDVLTGSRALAEVLGISRNTVNTAYSQLIAEGYVHSAKGVGLHVKKVPKLPIKNQPHKSKQEEPARLNSDTNILYDLTNSSQTSDLFPKKLWKRYTVECLDLLADEAKLSSYQEKQGEFYLRKNLLGYLEKIRGVHCDESQIILTCGLQQSLDYLCKIISFDNQTVLMEEPGFDKAATVFQTNNIELETISVDDNGIIVSELPDRSNIRALYATPSHQFPTGVTLSIDRRYQLLEWAEKNDVFIIEDDFDSELRYYSKPIPSLQSIDEHNRVIYLGTFSKALSPSIRMGYLILPPKLLQRYLERFALYNSSVPLLNQYVIARLIETGQYERHIRRLNQTFRKRLERFSTELSDVQDKIKISSNGSGQYFLLTFSQKVEQNELIERALKEGVKVYSTMKFWQEKAECPPNTLFLGFSKIDLEDIPDCVSRLKKAWAEWL
ncbi:PLP-dependent aminotransferase family protein [Enterococcus gilvus]|uniref:MocR-like pyridoxine biosynthesis transcription factor PdxR n=1 Tax=Enterococcus gilvus TaxID=160453 RepID=UPI001C8CC9C0|nr:PLP-dependent aminotransferase family protein [Enterococcus gilvus]MBX8936773.1 PLP-dependent aminotransferase family protein [Enterococcus gilvus]